MGIKELTLELTDYCPLNCIHCSSESNPKCKNLIYEDYVRPLINDAFSLGVNKISISGGEPTTYKDLSYLINQITYSGMSVEVFTSGVNSNNGILCTLSDELISNCQKSPKVTFIFSIHGSTAKVHDSITQTPGSFKILLESIKKTIKSGIICELNFVPMSINKECFEDILSLSNSFGIKKISILRFVPQGRGLQNKEKLELYREEENKFLAKFKQLMEVYGVTIRTGSPFNGIIPENKVPCRAGFSKLVIQANGNVLPCEVFKHRDRRSWGVSIYQQTLSEIWEVFKCSNLDKFISKDNCILCPIHYVLRHSQRNKNDN